MYGLSWIEIIYWGSTIIGGTLFILRTIMMLVGGGIDLGDADIDADIDIDGDIHVDGDHLDTDPDSDFSFKLLSMQGLTAFFMMFGLVGLTLLKANLPVLLTILGGGIAGSLAVWVISLLFSQMKRLQSDGTLQIENALGKSGSVYLTIPAKRTGQVQVTVQGALKIFDAASKDGKKIATGEKINVTGTVDNNTLIVEKTQ
jgi:membrane protein implicated in regulation of membrane protease activity